MNQSESIYDDDHDYASKLKSINKSQDLDKSRSEHQIVKEIRPM